MAGIVIVVKVFNILASLALSAVITTFAIKYNVYKDFSPDYALMLTIVGYMSSINTIVSDVVDYFLGENKLGICLKSLTSITLILGLIGTGIAVIVLIPQRLSFNMLTSKAMYSMNVTELRIWDHVHQDFQCCGLNSYTNWIGMGELDNTSLPDSCCRNFTLGCGQGIVPYLAGNLTHPSNVTIFDQSCTEAGFFSFFFPWTFAISGTSIAINIINLIVACVHCGEGESFEIDVIG